MVKTKKKLDLNATLTKIQEGLFLLPGEEEKQKFIQTIQEIIQELEIVRERIAHFPNKSEIEHVSGAAHTLISFFDSLKNNPLLTGILIPKGTKPRKPKSGAIDVGALQQRLEILPTEKIFEELIKQKKDTLLELSARMNIAANKKLTKDALADVIFKLGFANRRGYDLLKS